MREKVTYNFNEQDRVTNNNYPFCMSQPRLCYNSEDYNWVFVLKRKIVNSQEYYYSILVAKNISMNFEKFLKYLFGNKFKLLTILIFTIIIFVSRVNLCFGQCDTTFQIERIVTRYELNYSRDIINLSFPANYHHKYTFDIFIDSILNNIEKEKYITQHPKYNTHYIVKKNGKEIIHNIFINSDNELFSYYYTQYLHENLLQIKDFKELPGEYNSMRFGHSFPSLVGNYEFNKFRELFINDSCGCFGYRNLNNIGHYIIGVFFKQDPYYTSIELNIGKPDSIFRYPEYEKRVDLIYFYQSECKEGIIVEGSKRKWIQINYNTECHNIREIEWKSDE